MTLAQEAARAQRLLSGKRVAQVRRHRASEIILEFSDGTRLFIDGRDKAEIELSITDGNSN
jgi:hypothetical protein